MGQAAGTAAALAARLGVTPRELDVHTLQDELRRGVDHAASIYGGEDFALAFGGNEMAGYHTGPASHLTHLLGARQSHLDSAGYALDQKDMVTGKPSSPETLIDKLLEEERWRQVLSSNQQR